LVFFFISVKEPTMGIGVTEKAPGKIIADARAGVLF
jgi:hypothetical protein